MKTLALLLLLPTLAMGAEYIDLQKYSVGEIEELLSSGDINYSVGLIEDITCNLDELLESMRFLLDQSGMYPDDSITVELSVYIPPSTAAQKMRRDAKHSNEVADKLDKAKKIYEQCKGE